MYGDTTKLDELVDSNLIKEAHKLGYIVSIGSGKYYVGVIHKEGIIPPEGISRFDAHTYPDYYRFESADPAEVVQLLTDKLKELGAHA